MTKNLKLPISDGQLRTLVLDAVQNSSKLIDLYEIVAGLAANRGLCEEPVSPRGGIGPTSTTTGFMQGEVDLSSADQGRVRDVFWDLVVEGIVRHGSGDGLNNELPFFHVTDAGKRILQGKNPSPFDHDTYLNRVRADISAIDPVIITYLAESLRTFRIGCYLASTVTLGCAAEKALLLLMDATGNALPSPSGEEFLEKIESKMMRGKFEVFHKILNDRIRPSLKATKRDLDDFLDVQLDGIFEIIRSQRNSAGHPEGVVITQTEADANLYTFPTFLRRVYGLIEWLGKKPTL